MQNHGRITGNFTEQFSILYRAQVSELR